MTLAIRSRMPGTSTSRPVSAISASACPERVMSSQVMSPKRR